MPNGYLEGCSCPTCRARREEVTGSPEPIIRAPSRRAPRARPLNKTKRKKLKNRGLKRFIAQKVLTREVYAKSEQEAVRNIPYTSHTEESGWSLTEVPLEEEL